MAGKQTLLALALGLIMALCASALPVIDPTKAPDKMPNPYAQGTGPGLPMPMFNPQPLEDCGKWFCYPPVRAPSPMRRLRASLRFAR